VLRSAAKIRFAVFAEFMLLRPGKVFRG